jgi:hypothetical protein
VRFQLLTRTELPDFLDLPWEPPLNEWRSPRIVEVSRGVGLPVVRFVENGGRVYALKGLPERFAEREFRLLRELEERSTPVVELVGRRDVGLAEAVRSHVDQVLAKCPTRG